MSEIDESVDSGIESQEELTEPQNNVEPTNEDNSEVDDINEQAFSDDADGVEGNSNESDEETTKPRDETKSKKQSKAENAMYAQKRREQEAIIKKREDDAYRKGQLDLLIGQINNYTGEKIEDEDDVNEFLQMKEAEKAGFDPATELSKFQKQKARDERKQKEQVKFDIEADVRSFKEEYPNIDINELVKDKDFSSFAEPFAQIMPLKVIYKQYNLMKSRIDESANVKAEEKYKRKFASPGSQNFSSQSKPLSFDDMSDEEFESLKQKALRGDLKKT